MTTLRAAGLAACQGLGEAGGPRFPPNEQGERREPGVAVLLGRLPPGQREAQHPPSAQDGGVVLLAVRLEPFPPGVPPARPGSAWRSGREFWRSCGPSSR